MVFKKLGYAALVATAAAGLVLGSAGSSEAKGHTKKATVYKGGVCWGGGGPVCATRGNMKFTYRSGCYAVNDGAKVVSDKACPAPKAAKAKGAKKAAKKPAAKKK